MAGLGGQAAPAASQAARGRYSAPSQALTILRSQGVTTNMNSGITMAAAMMVQIGPVSGSYPAWGGSGSGLSSARGSWMTSNLASIGFFTTVPHALAGRHTAS